MCFPSSSPTSSVNVFQPLPAPPPPPPPAPVTAAPLPVTDTTAIDAAGSQASEERTRRSGFAANLLSTPRTRDTGTVGRRALLGA